MKKKTESIFYFQKIIKQKLFVPWPSYDNEQLFK